MTAYCLDTSALFDAGIRWYPPDIFPSFWDRLDKLIESGRLKIPTLVAREATKKTHTVAQWVKRNMQDHPEAFVEPDHDIQAALRQISNTFPGWTAKGRNQADPFVVATAMAKGWSVVTGEHPSSKLPFANPAKQHKLRIPNVCQQFNVDWIGIPDLIKEEKWTF
ncbi:MAG: DUF4411 family protein [Chromatiales bacterium]